MALSSFAFEFFSIAAVDSTTTPVLFFTTGSLVCNFTPNSSATLRASFNLSIKVVYSSSKSCNLSLSFIISTPVILVFTPVLKSVKNSS